MNDETNMEETMSGEAPEPITISGDDLWDSLVSDENVREGLGATFATVAFDYGDKGTSHMHGYLIEGPNGIAVVREDATYSIPNTRIYTIRTPGLGTPPHNLE